MAVPLWERFKKGRYVYYRCSGFKGKCDEPYVREEVLEQKFTAIIRSLTFDADVLAWVSNALRESHLGRAPISHRSDQLSCRRDYSRLQAESNKCMSTSSTVESTTTSSSGSPSDMAGRTAAEFCRAMEQHQNANQGYFEEGVACSNSRSRAADLFERQASQRKTPIAGFCTLELPLG